MKCHLVGNLLICKNRDGYLQSLKEEDFLYLYDCIGYYIDDKEREIPVLMEVDY